MKNIIFLGIVWFVSMPIIGYSNDMEVSLTWQSQSADLDIYIFNPDKAVCNWSHNNTAWGCRYDSESRGGRNAQNTLPYAEKATINLANSPENAGSYTVLAYYHDWQDDSSPSDIEASVDIHHHGELVGTFPFRLAKPGEQVVVWQDVIGDKLASKPPIEPPPTEPPVEPPVEPESLYSASGTIFDKFGHPVAGVSVEVNGKTILTDENGYWELNELAEGNYTVTAHKEGYLFDARDIAVGNDQNETVIFKPESVLDVKVVAQPSPVKQGDNVTYAVTITNRGNETATGIVLTETLPENTPLRNLEGPANGDCELDTLTCLVPELPINETALITVVVSNAQTAKLENTVTVNANEYPSDRIITKTKVIPYLSVAINDSVDPVAMEGMLTYTVTASLSDKAPTVATEVELALTLPQGVDVQAVNSDAGLCDISALPKMTCSLMDLTLGNLAAVNVDVLLKDPGLLVLIPQAEITATNYPAHSNRERTNISIPEGIEVDIVFVIDVTGSMQGEINGIIKAMKEFINEIDPNNAPLIALVVFTDEVKVKAFTRDLNVLLSAIAKLQADGGGTCPEASVEALNIAIPHTKQGGNILFATDASPYADANIEAVIEGLRNKGIRFNSIITGDCSQPDSWNELP